MIVYFSYIFYTSTIKNIVHEGLEDFKNLNDNINVPLSTRGGIMMNHECLYVLSYFSYLYVCLLISCLYKYYTSLFLILNNNMLSKNLS